MAEVLHELFPSEVEIPDSATYGPPRLVREAKAIMTDTGVIILEQTGRGRDGVRIAFAAHHIAEAVMPDMRRQTRLQTFQVFTEHGTVHARGSLGCACTKRDLRVFSYEDARQLAMGLEDAARDAAFAASIQKRAT